MATLHLWPQDERGQRLDGRWNWSLSPYGLVGDHSSLGYRGTDLTIDHAEWMGIAFSDVAVHELTSSEEATIGRDALVEYERGQQ